MHRPVRSYSANRSFRRAQINRFTPQILRLEDRAMPSATLSVYNRGDFYRADGQEVALDRRTDLLTVRVDAVAGTSAINELIAVGGPLQGFRVLRTLEANEFVLTSPPTTANGPNIALSDDADPRLTLAANVEGVNWIAPVLYNPQTDSWMAVTDEVIVALNDGADAPTFFAGDRRFSGFRPLAGTPDQFIVTLAGQSGAATLTISEELSNDSRVSWAEPNFWQNYQRFFTPNDPLYSSQWHLNTANDSDVDAPEAWDITQGGSSSITIAIVDDGIELTHPDLAANIWVNPGEIAGDGIDNDNNGWIDDINGWDFTANDNTPGADLTTDEHGTSTAGVAAAVGNNGLGVTGMAFKSKIMAVRIFAGSSATSAANIASAIYYAAGRTKSGAGTWKAANLTSNSWGGGSDAAINAAFTWASNTANGGKGIPNFAATGNDTTGIASANHVVYPAALSSSVSGVIAVGASTNGAVRSSYSEYGPQVDILAPSNGGSLAITTTDRIGANGYSSTDYTSSFGGTSSATPLAAGIGALVLALDPNLTANQVRGLLRNTTDYIGPITYSSNLGFNTEYGYGRTNAFTAVSGVGKAEIQVLNGITNVASGASTIDFGTIYAGASATKILRIRNQGTLDLNLSNLTVPAPFNIVSNFGDSVLSAGEITTILISFNPTVGGLVTQTATMTTNDADEGTFSFALRGTGLSPSISGRTYQDWDADGTRTVSEPGISGSTVYLDSNNNGILDTQAPYSSTDINKAIANQATVNSVLTIAGFTGNVSDVNVTININHTRDADLDIYLTGPTGVKVELTTDNGGTGDNYTNTVFDDQAATSITAGSPPFTGTFRPEGLLASFNNLDPNGVWTLNITDDNSTSSSGTLLAWSITLNNGAAESTTQVDANGFYAFNNLVAGNYNVRRVVPAGFTATGPTSYSIDLPTGSSTVTDRDFGLIRQNAIYGRMFKDLNSDGVIDGGEAPIVGRTVYLDTNNNAAFDDKSFTNSSVVSIPDNNATGASSSVVVSGVGTVGIVRVKVNITHPYTGDLALTLISPVGTSIALVTNRGGAGANFVNTILDDAATSLISTASAPFTGSFQPEGTLSTLTGQNANGTWTLKAVDSGALDVGTIDNWTLELLEPSTSSDAYGQYVFSGLATGTHRVREVVPGGWTETTPAGGAFVLSLAAGQTYVERNFGSTDVVVTPLTVVIDQAANQSDPSNSDDIRFTAVFSQPVSNFDSSDVVISGTAGATTAKVTGSGTTYEIAISGMSQTGTVIATIPGGAVSNGTNSNQPSTSSDNVVIYDATAPEAAIGTLPNITTSGSGSYSFTVTLSDDTAIDVSTIATGDLRVTGPNGFDVPANLVNVDIATNGTPRVATFSIDAPVGGWTATQNGAYSVALENDAIADTAENAMTGGPLGSFDVAIAPTVALFQINDGTDQRSLVKSFTVTFASVVTLPMNLADAFTLVRTGPGLPNGNVDLSIDTITLSTPTQTIAKITFSGAFTESGSLIDGRYDFAILGNQVSAGGIALDGDGNGNAGGDYTVGQLHRLFGDGNGDSVVSAADFNLFRLDYGSSNPASNFDFNGDGQVTASDFNDFRLRYGVAI